MAVKKIEELNVHRDVNSTEQFDVQDYLNENWDKMQDIVAKGATKVLDMHTWKNRAKQLAAWFEKAEE